MEVSSSGVGKYIMPAANALLRLLTAAEYSKGPEFFVAGRPVHRPCYTVFHYRNQSNQLKSKIPPLVGYLDYLDVTGFRAKKFRHLGKRRNTTSTRPHAQKLAQLTPREWTEDPYFICVLLSIAQLQRRVPKGPPASSYSVCSIDGFFDLLRLNDSHFTVTTPCNE